MAQEIMRYQAEDGANVFRFPVSDGRVWASRAAHKVSADAAFGKVDAKRDRRKQGAVNAPSSGEQHLTEATAKVKQIEPLKPHARGEQA